MNRIDRLYMEMLRFYQGDPRHIQHFVKVHSFSRLIGQAEGLDEEQMYILEAAAMILESRSEWRNTAGLTVRFRNRKDRQLRVR